tara:strand:+ start:653 stop:922 length:270 start_codon:yes stop_codon:yes gene_type:complete
LDKDTLNKVINLIMQQWLSSLARNRNFYMSSVMRDLTRFNNQVQDLTMSSESKGDFGKLIAALGSGKEDTPSVDIAQLVKDEVAKAINV